MFLCLTFIYVLVTQVFCSHGSYYLLLIFFVAQHYGLRYRYQCFDILPVWIASIKDWHDAPFLLSKSLNLGWLAIQLTVISFLSHISLRADNSICNCQLSVRLVVFTVSWSNWLSLKAEMLIWHDLVVKVFSSHIF